MRPSFLPRNFHHHVWIKRRFVSRARLLPHARFSKMDSYPATSRPSARTPSSALLRAQKYAPPFPFAPLVFSRQTHARGNERGTRDSSGFRLSSITRLDVSLPYQQQFPEIRLTLGIISPREFLSRHRRCVPSRFLSLSLCFSVSLFISLSLSLSLSPASLSHAEYALFLFLSYLYPCFLDPLSIYTELLYWIYYALPCFFLRGVKHQFYFTLFYQASLVRHICITYMFR